MVITQSFQRGDPGLIPGQGTKILKSMQCPPKIMFSGVMNPGNNAGRSGQVGAEDKIEKKTCPDYI